MARPAAAPAAREVRRSTRFPGEGVLRFQRDPLAFLRWLDAAGRDADAGLVRIRLGGTEAVLLRDPDLVGEVLLARPGAWPKGPQIRFVSRIFGTGLLTSEPPHHTQARKLVLPAFAHGRLAGYADTIVRLAEQHAADWVEAGTIDLVEAATHLTYDVAVETLFGAGGLTRGEEVRPALTEAMRAFTSVARNPVLVALSERVPIPAARRLDRVRDTLVDIIGAAVRQRRDSGDLGDDLLGMLLVAQDEETGLGLSDTEVIDESITILLAGHETTASALAWTWLLMAEHPEAEADVVAEADATPALGMDVVRALGGTRNVFAEAMRLYPPAYLIDRTAPAASWIGGRPVGRGTTVLISQLLLHRDPRFWTHPDRFDASRPGLQPKGGPHRHVYLPFSLGTRGCIGERFAWMEATLILAAVAQRLVLRPLGEWPAPLPSLTLRPDGAVPASVQARVPNRRSHAPNGPLSASGIVS
ncbi:MAG: cytochrome P450 [Bacteroidota bacterium]